ncbi:nucleotide exchange factor GrpE [Pseudothermotoga thermarum]|nr:nucleotide exchange factor GrpE [Pseudothermotoga thermarum]
MSNQTSEDLKAKLEELQKENEKLLKALKELTAEYENFKKDSLRDREQILKNANEYLLSKLIPALDDFERILENSQTSSSFDSLKKAVEMVYKKLWKILNDEGFFKIEPKPTFDPFEHEAVERVETDQYEEYTVLKVLENGYKYRNKVIKPLKVQVAVKPRGDNRAKAE